MNNNIRLEEVKSDDKINDELYEMLRNIEPENGFVNLAYDISQRDFATFIEKAIKQKTPPNIERTKIAQTTFWMSSDRKYIGYAKLRHKLDEDTLKKGGNISYAIRKEERNKGYGSIILKLVIEEAKKIGLDRVLVTCTDDNRYSKRIIESIGGRFDSTFEDELRYWIEVDS
jgi:predicted acetyltransferase